jgi:DNA recombination protein RmuC
VVENQMILFSLIALGVLSVGLILGLWRLILTQIRQKGQISELKQQIAVESQKAQDRQERLIREETALQNIQEKLEKTTEEKLTLEKQIVERDTILLKERESYEQRLSLIEKAEEKLKDTFQSLSSQALKSNNSSFLELANATFDKLRESAKGDLEQKEEAISGLVKPISEGLKQFDDRMQEMEKGRVAQISSVSELIQNLTKVHQETRIETQNLVSALRAPNIRGQWGELQLRRTIEISGMVKYCDFVEQEQVGGDNVNLRPDVIIRLPNNREVVIDSKAPLNAYLEACETSDPNLRDVKMKLHARQIRDHLKKLGQKSYYEHLKESPEFVVLFLPGEVFYSAALEVDPGLIEYGVDHKVLIATPTTLIALLKAIAYGWKNQEIAEKAGEISKVGRDLYECVVKMLEHLSNVRRSLNQTVNAFNQTIRSADKRLLPKIRKFKDLNAGTERAIPEIGLIEESVDLVDPPSLDDEEQET